MYEPLGFWTWFQFPIHTEDCWLLLFLCVNPIINKNLLYSKKKKKRKQAPWNAQLGKTSYHTREECEVTQLVAWKAKILLKTLSAGLHRSLLAWSHVPIKYKTMTATLLPTQWLLSGLKELVHCSKKYLNEQNTAYNTTKETGYNK